MFADEDICPICETPLILDHTGPNGREYWACPICDSEGLDNQRCIWFPDGENRCTNPASDGSYCLRCKPLHDSTIPILIDLPEVIELETEMRNCAFLWDLGIRADKDLLEMFRVNRRLQECNK